MAPRGPGFTDALTALLCITLLTGIPGCGDDDPVKPPAGTPGVIFVTNVVELETALASSVSGDTIEIRAEFTSSPVFAMNRSFTIPASRSPVTILGSPKLGFQRPELVFPTSGSGITLTGHSGSVIRDLDFRGGTDVIVLDNSNARIEGLVIRGNRADGVVATGAGSNGIVTRCLFLNPLQFGVSTRSGSTITVLRNTVIGAGDCGIYVDSNATILSNLCVSSHVYGIVCFTPNPTIRCNNSFNSGSSNYSCDPLPVPAEQLNAEVDPRFCPGGYRLSPTSPLIDTGGECGQIGANGPEPGGCTEGNQADGRPGHFEPGARRSEIRESFRRPR